MTTPTPLISREQYRQATGDNTSADDDVTRALTEAIAIAEAITNRGIEQGERTETLPVHRNGRVYPTATPVASVSSPSGAAIDGSAVTGASSGGGWGGLASPSVRVTAEVTYVGGFTNETLPVRLRRAICVIAHRVLHPSTVLAEVPAGATSVSVGDVSIGGDALAMLDVLDAGTIRDLGRYKRRTVNPGR